MSASNPQSTRSSANEPRASTPDHWQKFWDEAGVLDLNDVYGNDGRLVREITRLGDCRGRRILEVGAGTGRDAVTLADLGGRVATLDYVVGSLTLTVKAARAADVTIDPVTGDGLAMPFADDSFDVVFHQGLLEHFRDPLPLLRENCRVLKPGGYLVVDVPQRYHPYTVAKRILNRLDRWIAGWETEFSVGELEGLMADQGLDIVRSYGDWMVPGLWYRGMRKFLLTHFDLRLPMYPDPVPLFGRLGAAWRRWFGKTRLALYTTPTIGVIGRKPLTPMASSTRSSAEPEAVS